MDENKLTIDNPLTLLGFETDDMILPGQLGAICARAGVGKTSFIVQVAIQAMARGKKILHISLDEPVTKVNVWYSEMFRLIAQKNGISRINHSWSLIMPNRLIMTLRHDGFSVPRIEERLADLIEQNIFKPETLIIDGFSFEDAERPVLKELKNLAEKMGMNVWFTVTTHRHEKPDQDGFPVQLSQINDLFNAIFQMTPENNTVNVNILKGTTDPQRSKPLFVDPETRLIHS